MAKGEGGELFFIINFCVTYVGLVLNVQGGIGIKSSEFDSQ